MEHALMCTGKVVLGISLTVLVVGLLKGAGSGY